jgi:hypothetical protein
VINPPANVPRLSLYRAATEGRKRNSIQPLHERRIQSSIVVKSTEGRFPKPPGEESQVTSGYFDGMPQIGEESPAT